MGVYRTAFTSIDQTEPLTTARVTVPVVAIGGVKKRFLANFDDPAWAVPRSDE